MERIGSAAAGAFVRGMIWAGFVSDATVPRTASLADAIKTYAIKQHAIKHYATRKRVGILAGSKCRAKHHGDDHQTVLHRLHYLNLA